MGDNSKLIIDVQTNNNASPGMVNIAHDFKSLVGQLEGDWNGLLSRISTPGGIGAVAVALGLGTAAKEFLDLGREVEQVAFRMKIKFGESADYMHQKAEELSSNVNNLFKTMDFERIFLKNSAGMKRFGVEGETYFKLVGNAANTAIARGVELGDVMSAITSGIRGKPKEAAKLEIFLDDAYMKTIALGGALGKVWDNMTGKEKGIERANEAIRQTARDTEAAQEQAKTLDGSWKSIGNSLRDSLEPAAKFMAQMAAGLLQAKNWDLLGVFGSKGAASIDEAEKKLREIAKAQYDLANPPVKPGAQLKDFNVEANRLLGLMNQLKESVPQVLGRTTSQTIDIDATRRITESVKDRNTAEQMINETLKKREEAQRALADFEPEFVTESFTFGQGSITGNKFTQETTRQTDESIAKQKELEEAANAANQAVEEQAAKAHQAAVELNSLETEKLRLTIDEMDQFLESGIESALKSSEFMKRETEILSEQSELKRKVTDEEKRYNELLSSGKAYHEIASQVTASSQLLDSYKERIRAIDEEALKIETARRKEDTGDIDSLRRDVQEQIKLLTGASADELKRYGINGEQALTTMNKMLETADYLDIALQHGATNMFQWVGQKPPVVEISIDKVVSKFGEVETDWQLTTQKIESIHPVIDIDPGPIINKFNEIWSKAVSVWQGIKALFSGGSGGGNWDYGYGGDANLGGGFDQGFAPNVTLNNSYSVQANGLNNPLQFANQLVDQMDRALAVKIRDGASGIGKALSSRRV